MSHKMTSLAKNKEKQFIGTGTHKWCGIHLTIISYANVLVIVNNKRGRFI